MMEFESPTSSESLVLAEIKDISFKTDRVYLLYGKSKTGKTWLSSWMARKIADDGEKTIYIDTEGKAKRWFRKWDDYGIMDKGDNILYKKVREDEEFTELIDKLNKIVEEFEPVAVIIDTIIFPFADKESRSRAKDIQTVLKKVRKICLNEGLMGLVTTRKRMNGAAKGGQSLYHNTDHQIEIVEFEDKDMREMDKRDFMSKNRRLIFDENLTEIITIKEGKVEVL